MMPSVTRRMKWALGSTVFAVAAFLVVSLPAWSPRPRAQSAGCGSAAERDRDGDGHASYACGGDDCDDSDPNNYPGRGEQTCDDHDEDCNPCTVAPSSDSQWDADDDGAIHFRCSNRIPAGYAPTCGSRRGVYVDTARGVVRGSDCNDQSAIIGPGVQVCGPDAQVVLVCPASGMPAGEAPATTLARARRPPPGALSSPFVERACPQGTSCLAQPNGAGVCARAQ